MLHSVSVAGFGGIDGTDFRKVDVELSDNQKLSVRMSWDDGSTWQTIIGNYDLAAHGMDLPASLKAGFSGGTGDATAEHVVDNISFSPLDNNIPIPDAPLPRESWDFANSSYTGTNGAVFTPSSTPTFVAGPNSQHSSAIHFDGVDDSVSAPFNASENNYAVSFWFKTTDADGSLFQMTEPGGGYDRTLYLENGQIKSYVWHTGTPETIGSTGTFNDGEWHHIVHTFGGEGGGQRIYIDGAEVASGSFVSSDFNWDSLIQLGNGGGGWFNGDIAGLNVYNEALSNSDVLSIMQRGGFYAQSAQALEDQLNTTTDSDQHQSAIVATEDGGAISVWVSQSGGTYAIMGQKLTQEPQIRNIAVGDHSFESVSLGDSGHILNPSASAWTFSSGADGIHNYPTGMLTQEATDGSNAGYINTDNATISQVLSDSFSRNEQYTLQVDIGNRQDNAGFGDYEVRLKAGGIVLATDGSVNPAEGEFATLTLMLDGASIPANSAAVGQPLEIELVKTSGEQIAFDNVRLMATSTAQVAEGSEFKINTLDPSGSEELGSPEISILDNGNYAVVWHRVTPGSWIEGRMKVFSVDGTVIKDDFSIGSSHCSTDIEALSDDRFATVSRISNHTLRVHLFDDQGNETSSIDAGSLDGYDVTPSISALANGGFTVAWRLENTADDSARIRFFDSNGNPTTSEISFGDANPSGDRTLSLETLSSGQLVSAFQSAGGNLSATLVT